MIKDEEVLKMIKRLDKMTSRSKVSDNLGKFLGDGMPSDVDLRTVNLSLLLNELLILRKSLNANN